MSILTQHPAVRRRTSTSRPAPDAARPAPSNATSLRLETHWTRVLHRDLDTPWREAEAHDAAGARRVDSREAPQRDPLGPRTPVVAGVLLLGFYVALYLAVSAVVRVFAQDDAVLAQPGGGRDRPESASASQRTAIPPVSPVA